MTQSSRAKTLGVEGGGADNDEKSQSLMVLPSRQLGQGREGVMPLNSAICYRAVCHL